MTAHSCRLGEKLATDRLTAVANELAAESLTAVADKLAMDKLAVDRQTSSRNRRSR